MVIKYNNAWWCKIEIWTSADSNIGGADTTTKRPNGDLIFQMENKLFAIPPFCKEVNGSWYPGRAITSSLDTKFHWLVLVLK